MYTLDFTVGPEQEQMRFQICLNAFLMTNRVPPVAEYDAIVGVLRKLKQHAVRVEKIRGIQIYALEQNVSLEFTEEELHCILSHVNHPIWTPAALEDVVDTREWLQEFLGVRRLARA